MDRIVTGGVVLLIVFTPLAIGSAPPWAYGVAEAVIFVMVAAWMAKLAIFSAPQFLAGQRGLVLPLALFFFLGLFQVLPMPPALIRVLSPSTYALYVRTLSGWPAKEPYRDLLSLPPPKAPGYIVAVLPTESEVREGVAIPGARLGEQRRRSAVPVPKAASLAHASRWRPLSIAPSLTGTILLQFLAYSLLFVVVLFYPFGPRQQGTGEIRFYRVVMGTILASGLLVASIAIVERALWNGKVLWVFSPYDWGVLRPDPLTIRRARGPFVNPDHFASYLNLILPLAFAGAFSRSFLASRRQRAASRVSCALIAFVLVAGMLLSLSRAGWIGALVGASALLFASGLPPSEGTAGRFGLSRRAAAALAVGGLVAILATTSIFVGSAGRSDADTRLRETLRGTNSTLEVRLRIWRESIPMARDFPVFGVGLGCVQDLFAHYEKPPWLMQSVNAVHNDYLELLVSAGLLGFALLSWVFAGAARRLYRGLKQVPPEALPILAALTAGILAMAFQEFFDFNLQIPANALLFTLLLAMALRIAGAGELEERADSFAPARTTRVIAGAASIAALALAFIAMRQEKVPYPYSLVQPATPAEARDLVLAHPAVSNAHLWMADALGERLSPAGRARELEAAVWLDPTNPYARDSYAQSLVWNKQRTEAMAELERSVFASPMALTHSYLRPRLIPWLSADERAAVETGLAMAVAYNFTGSLWELGSFYEALRAYSKEGELFGRAAAGEHDAARRADLLLNAGVAYSQAGQIDQAKTALEAAAALVPSDAKPYQYLATRVFAERHDLNSARSIIGDGIERGADPFLLYLALADASEKCGDTVGIESSLLKANNARPDDFDAVWRLGSFYTRQNRFDQAALWMRKATEIRPESAVAFYRLGLAEEAGYHYFDAGRDFQKALSLAPQDAEIKDHYAAFARKAAPSAGGGSARSTP
jgi:O-antigen ligase/Tfp pilus assembly protein PilF